MKSRWASSRVFLLCSFFQNDRRPILKQLEILRLCDVDNPGKVSRLNPVRGVFFVRADPEFCDRLPFCRRLLMEDDL